MRTEFENVHGEQGQDLVEYAAVLLVVAAIILAVLSASSIGSTLSSGISTAVCRVFQGSCGSGGTGRGPGPIAGAPAPSPRPAGQAPPGQPGAAEQRRAPRDAGVQRSGRGPQPGPDIDRVAGAARANDPATAKQITGTLVYDLQSANRAKQTLDSAAGVNPATA